MAVIFEPFTGKLLVVPAGGGGGAVDSVNGQTGVVVLDADDVGAVTLDATTDRALSTQLTKTAVLSIAAGEVDWDFDDGNIATLTITGACELQIPTNMGVEGGILKVTQDGTGGHSLTFDSAFTWTSGQAPVIQQAANAVSYIVFQKIGSVIVGSMNGGEQIMIKSASVGVDNVIPTFDGATRVIQGSVLGVSDAGKLYTTDDPGTGIQFTASQMAFEVGSTPVQVMKVVRNNAPGTDASVLINDESRNAGFVNAEGAGNINLFQLAIADDAIYFGGSAYGTAIFAVEQASNNGSGSIAFGTNTGLTASTTQTQGGALQLTLHDNLISTVANAGDAVKLLSAKRGNEMRVWNRGANSMQVFPQTSDSVNGGTVNAAVNVAAGTVVTFLAEDATNWASFTNTIN